MDEEYKGNVEATVEDFSVETAESRRPFHALLDVGLIRTTTGNRVFGCFWFSSILAASGSKYQLPPLRSDPNRHDASDDVPLDKVKDPKKKEKDIAAWEADLKRREQEGNNGDHGEDHRETIFFLFGKVLVKDNMQVSDDFEHISITPVRATEDLFSSRIVNLC